MTLSPPTGSALLIGLDHSIHGSGLLCSPWLDWGGGGGQDRESRGSRGGACAGHKIERLLESKFGGVQEGSPVHLAERAR
jgi:hypothetical protein